jgi:Ca-activated chloride channel family protein
MRFTRYSRFLGFDPSAVDLGKLMEALGDSLLDSGFENLWGDFDQRSDSIDELRQALLEALLDLDILSQEDAAEMLARNKGEFRGSELEELINKLIERLIDEGYLRLVESSPVQTPNPENSINNQGTFGEQGRRQGPVRFEITEKGLDFLGYKTLRDLMGSFGRASVGRHETAFADTGIEASLGSRQFEFGDTMNLDITTTLTNALRRNPGEWQSLDYGDLFVYQQDYFSSCATVVMLDCSHSMILYGEDRFTPAKRVALALAHLIRTQFPGDSLHVVLFHDGAEQVPLSRLGSVKVGPYHTNTAEGLRLARSILKSQNKQMRQIVMITDGKPTAVYLDKSDREAGFHRYGRAFNQQDRLIYKNSIGNDPLVMKKTFEEIYQCRRSQITINTFMLARDYYLVNFVKKMTEITRGRAYLADPGNLSRFVVLDFLARRSRKIIK